MLTWRVVFVAVLTAAVLTWQSNAADPFAYFDWDVSYITASPLGVPQKVISGCFLFLNLLLTKTNEMFICVSL